MRRTSSWSNSRGRMLLSSVRHGTSQASGWAGKYLTLRQECVFDAMSKYKDAALYQGGQSMPLLHIALRAGKPEAYRQAIFDGLYRAMREALNVPDDDQFMTISEHADSNFRYGSAYGVSRSADVVYIQITVFSTRTPEQKKALFRCIAERLGE